MRVSCSQESLHRALSTAGRAVATKSTLPVLGNYLIETADDALMISATNLEIGITVRIDATVEKEGRVTVQARVLSDFVGSLPPGDVQLDLDQGPLTVTVSQKQKNTEAHVRGIDPDDFPPLNRSINEGMTLRLDPATLRDAISHVVFAAASDDSRPVLAGVQLVARDDSLSLAAADGFRMSVHHARIAQTVEQPLSIIVPARAMNELSRILGDAGDVVELTVSPNQSQLLVSLKDIWFTTRLIDGTFPDLSQIIPKDWNTRTVVDREVLLDAARRAAIFSRSANDVVRFDIAPASESLEMGRVTVTGNAADTGDNRDDVDAQVEGGEMQIAFNGRYLTDVLSVMRNPKVAFELQGANAAGVIKPADSDDFTHVIMPMVIGAN
ncbi:MAG: DNA polymerase III subunit beta [Thermomicrobiales bacterium]